MKIYSDQPRQINIKNYYSPNSTIENLVNFYWKEKLGLTNKDKLLLYKQGSYQKPIDTKIKLSQLGKSSGKLVGIVKRTRVIIRNFWGDILYDKTLGNNTSIYDLGYDFRHSNSDLERDFILIYKKKILNPLSENFFTEPLVNLILYYYPTQENDVWI